MIPGSCGASAAGFGGRVVLGGGCSRGLDLRCRSGSQGDASMVGCGRGVPCGVSSMEL
jgi:hypothetical protein